MKILKKVIFFLIAIIAIFLLIALFIPKDYTVKREVTIKKSNKVVFEYIKFLKNQNNYSKWAMMDNKMKVVYSGTDGTVGFISSWDSENPDVGKGSQEIKKVTPNDSINLAIHFIKPFEANATAFLACESVNDNLSKVTWSFSGYMKYPMNLFILCMNMDKMIGDDLEVGLMNLKNILEN